jgi:nucleoside 2-deoxyribosyltransferase
MTPDSRKSVYLSGPDVFFENMEAVFLEKMALCAAAGFSVILPGDGAAPPKSPDPVKTSRDIYRANVEAMRRSDFGVFHLTPFRGVSADVGTAFELGFMAALNKPLFGYTNVAGDYIDRVAPRQILPPGSPTWRDIDGCSIENYGNSDNLMLDSALDLNGAAVVRGDRPLAKRFSDLAGFSQCLELAKAHFAHS